MPVNLQLLFFGADGVAATGESASAQEKIEERKRDNHASEARILQLYNAWSSMLNTTSDEVLKSPDVPWPPHLDDCKLNVERNKRFDSYGDNSTFPHWTLWKGSLGLQLLNQKYSENANQYRKYPPWVCKLTSTCYCSVDTLTNSNLHSQTYKIKIVGSDEENYPLTRRVQRDIWIHQHPPNCSDPSLRFLVADWERLPGFGIGAQLAGMAGLLAIAIKEKRILVTNYYNRADHNGCHGNSPVCLVDPDLRPSAMLLVVTLNFVFIF